VDRLHRQRVAAREHRRERRHRLLHERRVRGPRGVPDRLDDLARAPRVPLERAIELGVLEPGEPAGAARGQCAEPAPRPRRPVAAVAERPPVDPGHQADVVALDRDDLAPVARGHRHGEREPGRRAGEVVHRRVLALELRPPPARAGDLEHEAAAVGRRRAEVLVLRRAHLRERRVEAPVLAHHLRGPLGRELRVGEVERLDRGHGGIFPHEPFPAVRRVGYGRPIGVSGRGGVGIVRVTRMLGLVAVTGLAAAGTASAASVDSVEVIGTGLDNPRHIAVSPTGDIFVAESGRGAPAAESNSCFNSAEGPACTGASGAVTRISSKGKGKKLKQKRIVTGLASFAPEDGARAIGPHGIFATGKSVFITNGGPTEPQRGNPPATVFRDPTLVAEEPVS